MADHRNDVEFNYLPFCAVPTPVLFGTIAMPMTRPKKFHFNYNPTEWFDGHKEEATYIAINEKQNRLKRHFIESP